MSLYSTATLQSVTFYNTITYYPSSGPTKRRMQGECCGVFVSSRPAVTRQSHSDLNEQQHLVFGIRRAPFELVWGERSDLSRNWGVFTLIQEMKTNPVRRASRPRVMQRGRVEQTWLSSDSRREEPREAHGYGCSYATTTKGGAAGGAAAVYPAFQAQTEANLFVVCIL